MPNEEPAMRNISRRKFIQAASGLALGTGILSGCQETMPFPDSRVMVATPESRAEYLRVLLDEICALGPHPIGSPEYDRAARIVRREMERAMPEVFLDTFRFERWRLTAEPGFYLGDRQIETCPSHGSRGTGPEGVRGVLRRIDDPGGLKYAIVDPGTDSRLAFISLSRYGRAVPLPFYSFEQEIKCPPIFNIGLQDVPLLEEAVRRSTPVRAVARVEFTPQTPTANVVGSLPGQNREEVVFLAHLDTVYNSPGANDNTATVIAMLMIAHAFSGARNGKTITFVATTGEEYDKLGAINYARRRRDEGTFENIRFLINLDSVTWGPDLKIHTADDDLLRMILSIDRRAGIPGSPRWDGRDGFMLDARPFRDEAVQAVYVNSEGYNLSHLWHRPEDLPGTVPVDCVENWFRLFKEYTTRLMVL